MKDKNGFEINSLPPEFTQIAMDSQYDYYKLLLTLPKQEEMQIHIAKLEFQVGYLLSLIQKLYDRML